jgi:hypothetical protein
MDAVGSRNGEWKFGKNPIYSCRAHIATSFVPAATVSSRADREEIERLREHEASVSQCARVRLVDLSGPTLFIGKRGFLQPGS